MIGADSNGAVVASKASIADIDIERTSSDVATASIAQGDVEGARCVARERVLTNGGVVIAGCVIEERLKTHGRVAGADPVAIKCLKAAGSVGITGGVLKKRSPTNGRVVLAGDVFGERLKTIGGIVVGGVVLERLSPSGRVLCACRETKERFRTKSGVVGTSSQAEKGSCSSLSRISAKTKSVRWRANRLCSLQEHKAGEHERNEKQAAPQDYAVHQISFGDICNWQIN